MNSKPILHLDWCSYEAAKFAVVHWHYTKRMPQSIVKIGVWENDKFIGAIIFGHGAASEIGTPFGLSQNQVCELVRIALKSHITPVSRIMAIAVKMVIKQSPGLRLVVSFADPEEGHHGGIYQANGWTYLGVRETHAYRVRGVIVHPKSLYGRYGKGGQSIPWLRANVDPKAERIVAGTKLKYVKPLDDGMKRQIEPLAMPYPKRPKQATSGDHPDSGGAAPTRTLHLPDDEAEP